MEKILIIRKAIDPSILDQIKRMPFLRESQKLPDGTTRELYQLRNPDTGEMANYYSDRPSNVRIKHGPQIELIEGKLHNTFYQNGVENIVSRKEVGAPSQLRDVPLRVSERMAAVAQEMEKPPVASPLPAFQMGPAKEIDTVTERFGGLEIGEPTGPKVAKPAFKEETAGEVRKRREEEERWSRFANLEIDDTNKSIQWRKLTNINKAIVRKLTKHIKYDMVNGVNKGDGAGPWRSPAAMKLTKEQMAGGGKAGEKFLEAAVPAVKTYAETNLRMHPIGQAVDVVGLGSDVIQGVKTGNYGDAFRAAVELGARFIPGGTARAATGAKAMAREAAARAPKVSPSEVSAGTPRVPRAEQVTRVDNIARGTMEDVIQAGVPSKVKGEKWNVRGSGRGAQVERITQLDKPAAAKISASVDELISPISSPYPFKFKLRQ